jgi:hypothetical protein
LGGRVIFADATDLTDCFYQIYVTWHVFPNFSQLQFLCCRAKFYPYCNAIRIVSILSCHTDCLDTLMLYGLSRYCHAIRIVSILSCHTDCLDTVMLYGLPDTNKHFMLLFKSYLLNKQLDCLEMLKVPIHQTLVPGTKEMWRRVKPPKTYSTYKLRYFVFMRIFWPSGSTSKYNLVACTSRMVARPSQTLLPLRAWTPLRKNLPQDYSERVTRDIT